MPKLLLKGNSIGTAIKGVLFDKDGTLSNSEAHLMSLAQKRIKESKKITEESDPKKLWSIITGRPKRLVQDIDLKDLPHRNQYIVTHDQMVYINDSKATNLTALKFALNKRFKY